MILNIGEPRYASIKPRALAPYSVGNSHELVDIMASKAYIGSNYGEAPPTYAASGVGPHIQAPAHAYVPVSRGAEAIDLESGPSLGVSVGTIRARPRGTACKHFCAAVAAIALLSVMGLVTGLIIQSHAWDGERNYNERR